jgi:glutathione S-transferase
MKKQLPSRPNLEQLKNQAKSLLKGQHAEDPEVLARVRQHHPRWQNYSDAILASARFTLADAQLVIANEYGFETWPALKAHLFRGRRAHPLRPRYDLCRMRPAEAISRGSTPCSPPIRD